MPDPRPCLCGCNEELTATARYYRPGHGSRHMALLIALGDIAAAQELPTNAMRERFLTVLTGMTTKERNG